MWIGAVDGGDTISGAETTQTGYTYTMNLNTSFTGDDNLYVRLKTGDGWAGTWDNKPGTYHIEAKDNGTLSDFSLDLYVEEGQVWFKGQVASEAQEKLVFEAAQSAKDLGVVKIYDMIEISAVGQPTADQANYNSEEATQAKVRQTSTTEQPAVASARRNNTPVPTVGSGIPSTFSPLQPLPAIPAAPTMTPSPAQPTAYPQQQAPANYLPVSQPRAAGARHDQPSMPNYAWPAYASHPNYGAVTYPQQYSPSVWPYIGPFYPYPQVPLGWRKVTLEWEDGWWFLDFQDR